MRSRGDIWRAPDRFFFFFHSRPGEARRIFEITANAIRDERDKSRFLFFSKYDFQWNIFWKASR